MVEGVAILFGFFDSQHENRYTVEVMGRIVERPLQPYPAKWIEGASTLHQ
jgi:hypothetical protein